MEQENAQTVERQFRLTGLWPGFSVPVPPVGRARPVLRIIEDETWIRFEGEIVEIPVPEELVIRELLDLDATNDEAVFAFVGSYGMISRQAEDPELLVEFWRGVAFERSKRHHPSWLDYQEPLPTDSELGWAPLEEVCDHLAEVQALARHFIAMRRGLDVRDAWRDYVWMDSEADAMAEFMTGLNKGLRPYHVRVEGVAVWDGKTHQIQPSQVDLYSALCLQLYNLLVDHDEVPRCCPSCNVHFFRQRGRSKEGQTRSTGVTYCSKTCADRMAARASRARKRAAKGELT